jgi:hypothetical protein
VPSIDQTLAIAGAAEGSWYTAAGMNVDLRYCPSFANANSGMSFGVFQFDCATNTTAQAVLQAILVNAVGVKSIDSATSKRIYRDATRRNSEHWFSDDDRAAITELLGGTYAKTSIDFADRARAASVQTWIDGIIAKAASAWRLKKITAPILTSGSKDNLVLFAYLLASLNRFPANEATFQNWLNGGNVKTLNGPAKGFQLVEPPTIAQMHTFFRSLRIWDGTQGKYQNLRDRLDPTLAAMQG